MATMENLQAAFAGESQANRRYLAFAKKADADGLSQVARLFRAAAEAETIEGEGYEFKTMYPQFVKEADAEKNQAAGISFRNAMAVEQVHHGLYSNALSAVEKGKDLPAAAIFVCAVCGNTVLGNAPDKCPVCGAPKARFAEVR